MSTFATKIGEHLTAEPNFIVVFCYLHCSFVFDLCQHIFKKNLVSGLVYEKIKVFDTTQIVMYNNKKSKGTLMKEYYKQRFYWIFNYTSKNFWYCLAKTLCIVVGLPIYAVMFVVEMCLTLVNLIFSWIPVLNVVVMVICKILMTVVGSTFYICILTDIKKYLESNENKIEYDVADENESDSDTSERISDVENDEV